MRVKAKGIVFIMYKGNITQYFAGTEFDVVKTKIMPHDKKEWYMISYKGFPTDGYCNPDDFEVIE